MTARYYVSTALPTILSDALGSSGNPVVPSLPGTWPTSYPFCVLIDWGLPTQEAILVTSAPTGSGPFTLPCTRGEDGTTAEAHAAGAVVVHGTTSYEPTLLQTVSGGSSGTVTSVTPTDASIVVSGTDTVAPTVATGTLDVIATQHPPAASVPMNSKKFTGLANGSASGDSAAFGQIPTALPPNGSAGGVLSGTYPSPSGLAATAVTAGSYMSTNLTVGADGRITSATTGFSPTISSPANGHKVQYNGSAWVNAPALALEELDAAGNSSTALTLSVTTAAVFTVSLTGDCVYTFTSPPSNGAWSFTLIQTQGSGPYTVTWPGTVYWQDGIVPTISTTSGAIDVFVFFTVDGGSIWFGSMTGTNYQAP